MTLIKKLKIQLCLNCHRLSGIVSHRILWFIEIKFVYACLYKRQPLLTCLVRAMLNRREQLDFDENYVTRTLYLFVFV